MDFFWTWKGTLLELLNQNRLACNWEWNNFKKYFEKERPEIQSESFFTAKVNDKTKTDLAISASLLKKQKIDFFNKRES